MRQDKDDDDTTILTDYNSNISQPINSFENYSWKKRILLIIFVLFACFLSISVASKIRFTPVISHALAVHFKNEYPEDQMAWLGRLYAVIVLCFVPVTTSIVDSYNISYKFCLIVSGLCQVIACLTNATVTHPLFFVMSDSILCGFGSTLAFAVFLLVIDDIFPKGNKFRVISTTFCQGSTIGSLFILNFYAHLAHYGGWVTLQISLAGIFCIISLVLILTCPEKGIKFTVESRVNENLNDSISINKDKNKLLGITFTEMQYSPSMFSWLVYHFIVDIIHQGIFIIMLKDSGIIEMPDYDVLLKTKYYKALATILYSCGESLFYITGAIFGVFFLGYLLHINLVFIVSLFLLLIIWQPLRAQLFHNGSMGIGHIICSCLSGCCIGLLNTCLITTAEEATMLRGRRIYPFMKLMEGLAFTLTPFLFAILDKASAQNIWLLTFAVFAAGNACIMVYILHKLYNRYTEDSKSRMQVSMKAANFFTKGYDTVSK